MLPSIVCGINLKVLPLTKPVHISVCHKTEGVSSKALEKQAKKYNIISISDTDNCDLPRNQLDA